MKGHIRKRGKSWELVVELGRNADGRRRQKTRTVNGSKRAAEAELARWVHELNTGMYADAERITVRQYLNRWLADYARPNVAPTTYERYEQVVRLHLAPTIGHLQLAKLKPLHIQALVAGAPTAGRREEKKALSDRTVLHIYRVLHAALEQAVRWQVLPRNPADAVRPPRADRPEMQVLDEKATASLLEAARGTKLYVPILLAATTGMRRGEILGLRWGDVDLSRARCSVKQALSSTKEGGLLFGAPKTKKSRRTIALLLLTVEGLKEHKRLQAQSRLGKGPLWKDHKLVCAGEDGSPWHPDVFTREWRSFCREAGVGVRFHDLRHGHATALFRLGVHPKVVSERLGHSTISITLDSYSHVLPGMQEDAAAQLDVVLRTAAQGPSGQAS